MTEAFWIGLCKFVQRLSKTMHVLYTPLQIASRGVCHTYDTILWPLYIANFDTFRV